MSFHIKLIFNENFVCVFLKDMNILQMSFNKKVLCVIFKWCDDNVFKHCYQTMNDNQTIGVDVLL